VKREKVVMRKLIFLFLIFFTVESKDLGVWGEIFEISERDLLEQIRLKLREIEKTGGLEAQKEKVERRGKETILHPQPIFGITHTQKIREYQFDPTITVTRDLSDHRGQIFAKKGERFNPLDRISFLKPLLFIDGDDEKQIKWAVSKTRDGSIQGYELSKVILVKGSPLDLEKRLTREIYFDQLGVLTTKLGIEHVPAIVFQKSGEKVLTIIEEVGSNNE
jgi:conjugal transfer pilus assembly protein TraW